MAHLDVSRVMFLRVVMNITETEFTRLVMGMARATDVLVHHCGGAVYCQGPPGFPDLMLAAPGSCSPS